MRLFVAAELPEDVRAALARSAPDGDGWRALRAESLHVTLAFLGEHETAEPVVAALRGVAAARVAAVVGEGVLLPPRRPRVYAARLEAPGLVDLAAAVSRALVAAGLFEPEARPFLPHVTLARARGGRPARRAPGLPAGMEFMIDSLALFRSAPNSRYTALFRSTLAA